MKKIIILALISVFAFVFIEARYDDKKLKSFPKKNEIARKTEKKSLAKYVVPIVSHDEEVVSITKTNNSKNKESKITSQVINNVEEVKEENKSDFNVVNDLEHNEINNGSEKNIDCDEIDYKPENTKEEQLKENLVSNKIEEKIKEEKKDLEIKKEEVKIDEKEKSETSNTEVIVSASEKENSIPTKEVTEEKKEDAYISKKEYYSPNGTYLGTNRIKVIDVSHHQGIIDWDLFAKQSDCYGVILRIGYWKTEDRMFKRNIENIKRLNIPYGIYIYSYASTVNGALIESNFTNNMIDKYNLNPTLGIFYDIESWDTGTSNSNEISKEMYDMIITSFINNVSSHVNNKYKVKVYSGRWYAMNRLGSESKGYVDWVAEYNKTCKYDGAYSLWQYTSSGSVPGVKGRVDISYII